jgi:hypothetical protein
VQVSELFPGYSHFFKVTPIPSVRPKSCQRATFVSAFPATIGDRSHETTLTPKQPNENKSIMSSQYAHVSYTQTFGAAALCGEEQRRSKADMTLCNRDVRYFPKSGHSVVG